MRREEYIFIYNLMCALYLRHRKEWSSGFGAHIIVTGLVCERVVGQLHNPPWGSDISVTNEMREIKEIHVLLFEVEKALRVAESLERKKR